MADKETKETKKESGFFGWVALIIIGFIVAPTDKIVGGPVRRLGNMLRDLLHIAGDEIGAGIEHGRIWLEDYGHTARVWTRRVFAASFLLLVLGLWFFHGDPYLSRVSLAIAGLLPALWLGVLLASGQALLYVMIAAKTFFGGILASAGNRLNLPELGAIKNAQIEQEAARMGKALTKSVLIALICVLGTFAVLAVVPEPVTIGYLVVAWLFIGLAIAASVLRGSSTEWAIKLIERLALLATAITLALVFLRVAAKPLYDRVFELGSSSVSWLAHPTWPQLGATGILVLIILAPLLLKGLAAGFEKTKMGPAFKGLSSGAMGAAFLLFIVLCVNGTISWSKLRGNSASSTTVAAGIAPIDAVPRFGDGVRLDPPAEPAAPPPPPVVSAEDLKGLSDFELLQQNMKELGAQQ